MRMPGCHSVIAVIAHTHADRRHPQFTRLSQESASILVIGIDHGASGMARSEELGLGVIVGIHRPVEIQVIEGATRGTMIVDTEDVSIDASVDQGKVGQGYGIAARLAVSLPGMDRAAAQALVDAAHQVCPYYKATLGNIDVTITLV